MQIGKQHLVFAQHCTFLQLRLFDLDDHIGGRKNLFCRCQHRGASCFVIGIKHADAQACVGFHNNLVAIVYQLANARRRHADTKLECFYFFWYSDFHGWGPEFLLSGDTIPGRSRI